MGYKYLVIGLFLAALFGAGYGAGSSNKDAEWQAKWDAEQAEITKQNLEHERSVRELEQKLQYKADEVDENAKQKFDAAQNDAADANDAGNRLRESARAAAARAGECPKDPTNAALREAATKASRMLANVLEESSRHAAQVAKHADEARIAGEACEIYAGMLRDELEKFRGGEK